MSNPYFVMRDQCPACASVAVTNLYRKPFDAPEIANYLLSFYGRQGGVELDYLHGATYDLRECGVCGCIFQREILNDFLMERLYESWIDPEQVFEQHNREDDLRYFAYYASEIMQIAAFFNAAPSALKFMDFGMGWGKWALMAKAFGCASYGAELSAERIAYAKSNGITVIQWEEMPNQDFDFINTEQVFEHIPEPLQTLKYLASSLKPSGLIKISVPTANNIERRLRRMDWTTPKKTKLSLNPVAPLEHINFYRRASLVKMAEKAGLEEVHIPLRYQYQYATNWGNPKQMIKNLLRPIYRNILQRQNYVFLRRKPLTAGARNPARRSETELMPMHV